MARAPQLTEDGRVFGGDNGNGNGGLDLGELLVALFIWREIEAGRLDASGCVRAGCALVLLIGGALLAGLMLLAAFGSS